MADFLYAFLIVNILFGTAVGDYPPPSEDSNGYYNRRHTSGGSNHGSYLSDWNQGQDWSQLGGTSRCVDIPSNLTLCRDIGYPQMHLPNLLEHDTMKEVIQQASSWQRLVKVNCHADTQIFLCSLFAPVCLEKQIWPCRSLCEAVKSGCEDRMLKYGFPWPEMLRCDQFPPEEDLCVGLRSESVKDDNSCSACTQLQTSDSIVDQYCRADFVMRIKLEQSIVTGSDLKITAAKKKKIFKSGYLKAKELRDASLFVENSSTCDCPILETINGKREQSSFIVMGVKKNDRLTLTSIQAFSATSKELGKAMRAVKREGVCVDPGNTKGNPKNKGKSRRPISTTKKAGGKSKTTPTTAVPTTTRSSNGGRQKKKGTTASVAKPNRRLDRNRPSF